MLCTALLLACTGCGSVVTQPNYFTLEHAFTDAAAARAFQEAAKTCAHKKLAAVKTGGACSLTRCTTHYQCMTREEAAANQK
jgi:hypothetical protein